MPLQKPTIVLFDMDGTTVRHINPKLLHFLEALDDFSFRAGGWLSRLIGHRDDKNVAELDKIHKKPRLLVHRAIHKVRRKPVEQIVEPCPGIYALLDSLREYDVPMALVSNGLGKGYGHDVLSRFNLEPYFETTIFREDIHRSKPHPDPLLRALSHMKDRPGPDDVIWYIGDRRKDMLAALAANDSIPALVQPVAYGLHAAMALLEQGIGPDHIVMHYPDFTKRTRSLLSGEKPGPFGDGNSRGFRQAPAM